MRISGIEPSSEVVVPSYTKRCGVNNAIKYFFQGIIA